jgi:hypothetical protein
MALANYPIGTELAPGISACAPPYVELDALSSAIRSLAGHDPS